jgi:hypothetical protein
VSSGRSDHGLLYRSWLPGIALILLGAIFFAQSYFGATLQNWWALFILIPALSTLATAYALWRDGHPSWAVGPFVAGVGFALLAAFFLFDLPIGRLWPLLLIVAGVALLFGRRGWR